MTIYDQDYLAESQMQEDAVRTHKQAVQDSVAEGQNSEPEEFVEEVQEQEVQEAPKVQEESDADRNWRAVREKEKEMQEQLARISEENAYLKGRFEAIESQQENPLDDEDLLSVGQGKKMLEEMRAQYEQELYDIKIEREENKMRAKFSDYDEVMEKYSIPLLKQNKDFARGLQNAEDKAHYAYQIGRGQMLEERMKSLESQQSAPQRNRAERIVENSRRPGTLSNVGGGQQSISKAEYWAGLSDTDFMREAQKNLGDI